MVNIKDIPIYKKEGGNIENDESILSYLQRQWICCLYCNALKRPIFKIEIIPKWNEIGLRILCCSCYRCLEGSLDSNASKHIIASRIDGFIKDWFDVKNF